MIHSNKIHARTASCSYDTANAFYLLMTFFFCFLLSGCSKSYLEAKPDKKLVLPSTLQDLQALLDNTTYMNSAWPSAGEIEADNYYVTSDAWNSFSYDITSQNLYIWGDNVFNDNVNNEWFLCYQVVFYANTVLENVGAAGDDSVSAEMNNVKGQALFFPRPGFL